MKETTPLVSVLMPVYNGMPYLPQAVESILNQTFTDFEFIIVDDCSTDGSAEYLHSLHDARIGLIDLRQNLGVTGALQEGMKRVRGKYVARLDADDVAKPERLSIQVDFLEAKPAIGLLGSSYELIDSQGTFIKYVDISKDDIEIRWKLLFKNPFFHSTVMFRYDILKEHQLNYTRKHGEDYQLWIDILPYCKGCIVHQPLIQYRTHNQSWTFTMGSKQLEAAIEITKSEISKYIDVDSDKIDFFLDYARGKLIDQTAMKDIELLFAQLVCKFISKNRNRIHYSFIINRLKELRKRAGIRAVFTSYMNVLISVLFQSKVR